MIHAQEAATIFILAVVWIGYTAWPIYDLLVLVRAIETRDVETVTRHVYFDAVRASLTNQVVAAYVRRTGIHVSPLAQNMAGPALADPIVKKLISPEALSELLSKGWPVTVVPDSPPGTVGITSNSIGTVWQIFANSEYGIGRFEVSAPAVLPSLQQFRLTFRLLQWRWQLVAVILPETIQNLTYLRMSLSKPRARGDGSPQPLHRAFSKGRKYVCFELPMSTRRALSLGLAFGFPGSRSERKPMEFRVPGIVLRPPIRDDVPPRHGRTANTRCHRLVS